MTQPMPSITSLFKLEYPQSVGVYGTYDEAQQVVDFLADARFPVENLCIVGTDLRSIERVLGRRSWGSVIGAGVQSGLTTGVMITLIIWILMPSISLPLLVLSALAIGIFVGVASSAFGYWLSQGKRDFRSVSQTMATKYELLAEHKVAGQARELIATMPGARRAQFNPAPAAPANLPGGYPPPGYGQPPYGQPFPPAGYPQQPGFGQPYPPPPAPGPAPYGSAPAFQPTPGEPGPAAPASERTGGGATAVPPSFQPSAGEHPQQQPDEPAEPKPERPEDR